MSEQVVVSPIHCPETKTTMVQAIWSALEHAPGFGLSISEAMGFTAHAFRININPKSAEMAGPTSYDGGLVLQQSIENLGYKAVILDPDGRNVTPEMLSSIVTEIKRSIDRGMPVVGWDLFEKEFGVIYGYDDSLQVLYAKDGGGDGPIPYEKLPNRRIVCVGIIGEPLELSARAQLHTALDRIVRHGNGNDGISFPKCWHGLRGYDAWIQAYEQGKISPKGNAYNIHVVRDARRHAVAFLERLLRWDDGSQESVRIRELAEKAIPHYAGVVDVFDQLKHIYPYPLTGKNPNPRLKEQAEASILLLREARAAEEQGLHAIAAMHRLMEQVYTG